MISDGAVILGSPTDNRLDARGHNKMVVVARNIPHAFIHHFIVIIMLAFRCTVRVGSEQLSTLDQKTGCQCDYLLDSGGNLGDVFNTSMLCETIRGSTPLPAAVLQKGIRKYRQTNLGAH